MNSKADKSSNNAVVLIHGLAAHRMLMWPLARKIRRAGYRSFNFGYRSWLWSIEHHAARLRQFLEKLERDEQFDTLHIVAHSMGGIVARTALLDADLRKFGRLVMLGSPNDGSPAARRLGYVLPFAKTLRQVSDAPTSFVRTLPHPTDVEVGVVAASYDFVIPEESSHLATETDHVQIFSGHNGLLIRPTAAKKVISFLKNGRFESADESP